MQILVLVPCSKGPSLREAMVSDPELLRFQLDLVKEKLRGRRPGWAKLKSALQGIDGSLNIQWHANTSMLECRIITKSDSDPAPIAGDLVAYLMDRFSERIQAIHLIPRE
ncbi:MAG: hypothetical protein NTU91_05130 [Chloroflexi bacterium]|jgi:hypothetical protein|nr:hypothetical protein [Chloroflexota bacterium]